MIVQGWFLWISVRRTATSQLHGHCRVWPKVWQMRQTKLRLRPQRKGAPKFQGEMVRFFPQLQPNLGPELNWDGTQQSSQLNWCFLASLDVDHLNRKKMTNMQNRQVSAIYVDQEAIIHTPSHPSVEFFASTKLIATSGSSVFILGPRMHTHKQTTDMCHLFASPWTINDNVISTISPTYYPPEMDYMLIRHL